MRVTCRLLPGLPLLLCTMMISSTAISTTAPPQTATTPKKLRRYLLARHGETNFNREMREQGTLDTPVLTLEGISQAAGLGMYVRQRGEASHNPIITRTWCSPLMRCRQTYAAVAGCCHHEPGALLLPTPTIRSDLQEINLCEWQGRLTQEIMEVDSVNWNTFVTDPQRLRLDHGTFAPVLDCWERGWKNWQAIRLAAANEKEDGATFIMCHGGMGQCMLLQALLGIHHDDTSIAMFRQSTKYAFDNGGCIEVEWADDAPCATRWRRVHPVLGGWTGVMTQRIAARRGEDGIAFQEDDDYAAETSSL